MSSLYVRNKIKDFLATELPAETVIDMTGKYQEIKEFIADAGLQPADPWLGLEFIGSDEAVTALSASNTRGRYVETGAVYFHFVARAKTTAGNSILTRGEQLRELIRGRRLDDLTVQSVTPVNFKDGATLEFQAGYLSGSCIAYYQRELNL